MATIHLTPEEKRAMAADKERRAKLYKAKTLRNKQIKNKAAKEVIARKEAEALAADPPPLEVKHFFGAAQTTLPATIRAATVPLETSVPEDIQLDDFIEQLSRQPDFKETLGENIEDPRVSKFLKLIGELENRSMTWCARSCGLSNQDLARIWRNSKFQRAFFRIVNRVESFADKVVDDAMGKTQSCRRCEGLGYIDVPEQMRAFYEGKETAICPNCEGRKVVTATGSAPHAQLLWERIGWSKKGGGVNLNINMGEHMADATMRELDGIEAEVIEAVDV